MEKLPEHFKQLVGKDARGKYFSGNPFKQWLIERFFNRIFSLLKENQGRNTSILEVGCGEGIAGFYIKRMFPQMQYFGVDIMVQDLVAANQIVNDMGNLLVNGKNLPFPDSCFESVLCLEVLEHVDKWEQVFRETLRVARKQIIISVPAFPYYQLSNFIFGKNLARFGEHPDHINRFRADKFKGQLDKACKGVEWKRTVKIDANFSFPWCIANIQIKV